MQFERLLAELSARFINLPVAEVDGAITDALRSIVELLVVDRSQLIRFPRSGEARLAAGATAQWNTVTSSPAVGVNPTSSIITDFRAVPIYGIGYGMQKTTVYIPEDVKRALSRVAASRGVSEAELIREALRVLTSQETPPKPRLPLFKSGKPRLAERVDEALSGFGES